MTQYSPIVLDHFYNPRNKGSMADADVVGRAGAPGHGPFMVLYLKLDGERIVRASFQTYGCAPAIAAGSLLAERLTGRALADAARFTAPVIEAELGGLPQAKKSCARIAAEVVADALAKSAARQPPGNAGDGT